MTYNTYKALIAACEAIEEFDMSEPDISAVCAELRSQLRKRREDRDEAAWYRSQQTLRESGGPDDSNYRKQMMDAGRGHLLKG